MKWLFSAATVLAFSVFANFAQAKPVTISNPKTYTSAFSYGSSYTHEISTDFTSGGLISGKNCKDCGTGTSLSASISYLRYWQDNMQIGGEGAFQSLSKEFSGTGKSATLIQILGVGVYNFSSDLTNAIFAKAGIGLYPVLKDDNSDYENKFGLFLGVGKRFSWISNVTYTPELRLVKRGDIDFGVEVKALNFSICW